MTDHVVPWFTRDNWLTIVSSNVCLLFANHNFIVCREGTGRRDKYMKILMDHDDNENCTFFFQNETSSLNHYIIENWWSDWWRNKVLPPPVGETKRTINVHLSINMLHRPMKKLIEDYGCCLGRWRGSSIEITGRPSYATDTRW